MKLADIIQILRANVDQVVEMKYKTGETESALVINVDDEGVVYDLTSLEPEGGTRTYWTPFLEIEEVRLANAEEP